jgi:hypothetical protein
LLEALKAIAAASEAARKGHYGCGPKNGFRNTAGFRHWTSAMHAAFSSSLNLVAQAMKWRRALAAVKVLPQSLQRKRYAPNSMPCLTIRLR